MGGTVPERVMNQAQFRELVEALPWPVTKEARREYNRLRAIAARRGYAWPYRNYIDPSKRRLTAAKGGVGYDDDLPVGAREPTPEETRWAEIQRNMAQQTRNWIVTFHDWEYFTGPDGAIWRGYKTAPLDADGFRSRPEYCGPAEDEDKILTLAAEDRFFAGEYQAPFPEQPTSDGPAHPAMSKLTPAEKARATMLRQPRAAGGKSFGHVAEIDGWEYFHGDDTYLYRAEVGNPLDEDGYRLGREYVGRYGDTARILAELQQPG